MASFSYKYHSFNDPNPLFITWDTGYTNLKVYYKGKMIKHLATPQELLKGILFDSDELKNISIQLTKEKTMVVKVSVDEKEYLPENKIVGRGELGGLIAIFWFLFAFGVLGAIFEFKSVSSSFDNVSLTILIIIDIVILLSYGLTASLLKKEYAWSYFIGGSMYVLTTFFVVYNSIQGQQSMGIVIGLIIRGVILLYVLKFFPVILGMMKNSRKIEAPELLDDF